MDQDLLTRLTRIEEQGKNIYDKVNTLTKNHDNISSRLARTETSVAVLESQVSDAPKTASVISATLSAIVIGILELLRK